jgi:thiol-disulfide isomerase/thioredoxin
MLTRIYFGLLFLVVPFLVTITAAQEEDHGPPTLAIGATAPDFCLKGVDEQTQSLKDYRSSKVLMIAFICNHCPTSQLYETRIERIAEDYKDRGVAVVAIEPNNPNAVRLDEMGYTDVGDSFEEMQIRAEYRHFSFPYLYDGEDQKISNLYGPTATPHVFIFDQDRKLHYDARLALDAVLAGTRIEVAKTPAVGCSTKWLYKEEGRREEMTEIERKPVTVRPVSIDDLRALRKNTTGKLLLVDF